MTKPELLKLMRLPWPHQWRAPLPLRNEAIGPATQSRPTPEKRARGIGKCIQAQWRSSKNDCEEPTMNALTLAEYLDRHIHIAAMHDECANKLRRQHEAIVKLREALHNTNQSLIGHTAFTYSLNADEVISATEQILKDTEEFQ